MVRNWEGLETDEAWEAYVDQVCALNFFYFVLVLSSFSLGYCP
jgi:hypothetical protein